MKNLIGGLLSAVQGRREFSSAMTIFDVRIPGLKMTVVAVDGQNVQPVPIEEFRIAVAETYDVIVEPEGDKAYTVFAESLDRSGFARDTLAPRQGMVAPIPERRSIPKRTMKDMGMDMSKMKGMEMDGMEMDGGSMDGMKMDGMNDSKMDHSKMDHSKMDMPDMKMDEDKPTPETELEDYPFPLPPPGKDFPRAIEDSRNHSFVLFELLEYQSTANSKNALNWDMIGWYGGDYNRLWFRSEGEIEQASKSSGDVEFQGLYGRLIAPFYDFQVGLRYDQKWEGGERNSRFHAVVGLTGLVPYEYEVEPLMFISNKGDVSFRFMGVKDILINQRTIFEGRFETNIAVQKVPKFGVGAGLNDMEFGIRIRREITREFAPYIGVSYTRLFGETADFARLDGGRADKLSLVAGVRLWF